MFCLIRYNFFCVTCRSHIENTSTFYFLLIEGNPGADGFIGRAGNRGPKGAPGDYGDDGYPGLTGEAGIR